MTNNSEVNAGDRRPDACASRQQSIRGNQINDNLYATGASGRDVLQSWKIVSGFEYYDDQKEHQNLSFTDAFNSKTGKMNEGFNLVEYEIELTNVDSHLSAFDDSVFRLLTYCNYTEEYGRTDTLVGVPQAYILEHDPELSGTNDTFTLKKGKTHTLHVGFIVNDNHRGSLSQIGLSVGSALEDKRFGFGAAHLQRGRHRNLRGNLRKEMHLHLHRINLSSGIQQRR